jgi:hypothetical protein
MGYSFDNLVVLYLWRDAGATFFISMPFLWLSGGGCGEFSISGVWIK